MVEQSICRLERVDGAYRIALRRKFLLLFTRLRHARRPAFGNDCPNVTCKLSDGELNITEQKWQKLTLEDCLDYTLRHGRRIGNSYTSETYVNDRLALILRLRHPRYEALGRCPA